MKGGRGGSRERGGGGAGEERVGRGGSGGGERNGKGRGQTALLSAATALLICYLFLHLPPLLSFSWLLLFIFLFKSKDGNK